MVTVNTYLMQILGLASLGPRPKMDAAADGLHHRYASVGSGDTGINLVARGMTNNKIYSALATRI